jgi:phosphoglycerate dehydrogenase-like enzyme
LLQEADIVSIHLVLSESTRGRFGARDFELMGPGTVLINTSRGPIVNEDALIEALQTHRIAGAGLDVYDHEPLARDHPLLSLDNTVLSPHVGHVTEVGLQEMYRQAVRAIGEFLHDPTKDELP